MASKRKFEDSENDNDISQKKQTRIDESSDYVKKHTLDSDEEDSGAEEERYNIMHEDDFEGEEDGTSGIQDETKITPFNMKEELEEGHFDREGHFQWNKDKEIRDNWLDNIDWIKVKTDKNYIEKTNTGLADSSDDDDESSKGFSKAFNEIATYKEIFSYMKPGETIARTLQRLGKNKPKLSTIERWQRKKAGLVDTDGEVITKVTELANNILTNLGNMDIYQETYEMIGKKINKNKSRSKLGQTSTDINKENDELDMYAEDFDQKEKTKLKSDELTSNEVEIDPAEDKIPNTLQWEYKWKQADSQIHGPFTTEQMQNWVDEKYFANGVFVRKYGVDDQTFYNSNRIDFELYL